MAGSESPRKGPDTESENSEAGAAATRRRRQSRLFPTMSFKEALFLGDAIQKYGAGQPIRRLTLFETLSRSPDSGTSRKLITASNQYGITSGSYTAETLELTTLGKIATDPNARGIDRTEAQMKLGIEGISPFRSIYERYMDSRLPTVEVLRDAAKEADVPVDQAAECVETFLANARELGLIRTIGGSEHLVKIDAVLQIQDSSYSNGDSDEAVASDNELPIRLLVTPQEKPRLDTILSTNPSNTCFIISPIGNEDSIERKHADLVLSSLIEPALAELGLVSVRADRISKPGLITGQVINHVVQSRLVIADLSFGNPNVYYELALRHAIRRPVVQIIRSSDSLPFDVGQFRTVRIDMTDIYTLVPQLELHRQEIARQARAAIEDMQSVESPLSQFYPTFWSEINQPDSRDD